MPAGLMPAVNRYYNDNYNFSREDIQKGKHREAVGGMWDEIGKLQFDFLIGRGLRPHHRLLDIGCGALRGGLHFISYLDAGNYYGADLNASLIEAGQYELQKSGLTKQSPHFLVTETFELYKFGVQFDYALAVSLFTHLPADHIRRCLIEIARVLKPEGLFFATFFEAPESGYRPDIIHEPGGIRTRFNSDPYHYSFAEIDSMAKSTGLQATLLGPWRHPRAQRMISFSRRQNHR